MALPSIIFLLAFVGGVFGAFAATLLGTSGYRDGDALGAVWLAVAAAVAAGAAYLQWRRFMVPITVAAGAAAVAATGCALVLAVVPNVSLIQFPLMAVSGIAISSLAMWWDISDRDRRTRRSDVAFWLHLLAAPLIVHPVFNQLGLLGNSGTIVSAVVVLTLYVAIGVVALAIDRRALMVCGLAYVLIAGGALFCESGAVGINIAVTVMIIGSALLLLSAFWQGARGWGVGLLPTQLAGRLPPAGIAPTLQPAS